MMADMEKAANTGKTGLLLWYYPYIFRRIDDQTDYV